MLSKTILTRFREVLRRHKVDVYILPRTDEHQSEYLCASDQRLRFLSGFTGSNGLALVSQDQALLWTDGRYYLQAEAELGQGWAMRKMGPAEQKWHQYLLQRYGSQRPAIEIDGRLVTAAAAKDISKQLAGKELHINFSHSNLVDEIWPDRPGSSAANIYLHETWSGRSLSEKVQWIRAKIRSKDGGQALFNDLGEIAWILNLRSSEIPYNPFFKSVLTISLDGGALYLPPQHPSFHDPAIRSYLQQQNIQIAALPLSLCPKVLCQPSKINYMLYQQIEQPIEWQGIDLHRAVRTQKQLEGFRRCHLVDGVAMVKFWAWRAQQQQVTQYEAACYLDNLRSQQKHNMGLSFATISGGGPNGAIIHYHATKEKASTVTRDMLHLVDSGGQYLDGTTDVTRAFHFGTPTPDQKQSYTQVLLGNMDIERLTWPKSTRLTGMEIEVLARRHLWAAGKDYSHGTGHGVGHFGSVHEGPVGISRLNKTVLEPGMIVTNQPGYYCAGKYGIRIQNMLVVREVRENLLGFQNLTLCPYDRNLLQTRLLARPDIQHINEYHQRVWDRLSLELADCPTILLWLRNATKPLPVI